MTAQIWAVGGLIAVSLASVYQTSWLLAGIAVMAIASRGGLFEKRANGYKELEAIAKSKYENEHENLLEEREKHRVERHALKDELAKVKAELLVERSKPDLSAVLEQQRQLLTQSTREMTALLSGLTAAVKTSEVTQRETLNLLMEWMDQNGSAPRS